MKKGKFIVFEGGEGSGKTSAIEDAIQVMESVLGNGVVRTREPGGTPGAEAIRSILITKGADYDPTANALLFAAARRDHVEKVIRPALDSGRSVLSDRFILSTIAYQGAEGADPDFILQTHHASTKGLFPDHTIILDVDPRVGLERSRRRLAQSQSNEDRFEDYDLDFHDRMREIMRSYDLSAATVIDANRKQDEVLADVRRTVQKILQEQ